MATSMANIALAYSSGQSLFRSWSKAPSATTASGIWFDLSMSPGNPFAQYYFGTPLTATKLARSTDGGLDHGGAPGGSYKKILTKFEIQTVTSTAAVNTFDLLDYLMYYAGIGMDAGVQAFSNPISLPRYTDFKGVQMMMVEQFPYVGAATFQVTYTNQDGVAGRVTPVITCNSQVSTGTIVSSNTATAGSPGKFLPLQSGDSGVQLVESIEFFTPDVGVLALVLVKPLAYFSIFENTMPNYFDLWNDFSILPEIKDDAYLNLICLPTGTVAGAQIIGNLTTIWS
jgi:hypothetical protein